MIDHLIFDFDGTISDSYPIFVRIMREICEDKGWEINRTDEQLLKKLKINVRACWEDLGYSPLETRDLFWQYQVKYCKDYRAFPAVQPLLEKAVSLGKKNYVYTHSPDVVLDILKNMGLDGYFTDVITSSYGFPAKPAPDALQFLCQKHSLDPARCMMIGDRPIDTQAGHNAGMIGCLWDAFGEYPDEEVEYKIQRLEELTELLETV